MKKDFVKRSRNNNDDETTKIKDTFSELVDIYSKDLPEEEYESTITALKKVLNSIYIEKTRLGSDI